MKKVLVLVFSLIICLEVIILIPRNKEEKQEQEQEAESAPLVSEEVWLVNKMIVIPFKSTDSESEETSEKQEQNGSSTNNSSTNQNKEEQTKQPYLISGYEMLAMINNARSERYCQDYEQLVFDYDEQGNVIGSHYEIVSPDKHTYDLTWNSTLEQYAKTRAQELAQSYGHIRPNGQNGANIIGNLSNGYGGECIASSSNPNGVKASYAFNLWKNSNEHWQMIMGSTLKKVGIAGYYYQGVTYWCLLICD